jgi:hypothetical protein
MPLTDAMGSDLPSAPMMPRSTSASSAARPCGELPGGLIATISTPNLPKERPSPLNVLLQASSGVLGGGKRVTPLGE